MIPKNTVLCYTFNDIGSYYINIHWIVGVILWVSSQLYSKHLEKSQERNRHKGTVLYLNGSIKMDGRLSSPFLPHPDYHARFSVILAKVCTWHKIRKK